MVVEFQTPVCFRASFDSDSSNLAFRIFERGKRLNGEYLIVVARSWNDQVATDMRLWLREELKKLRKYLQDFLLALADRAEQEIDHLCPGM